jgi:hypothetical protein
MTNHLVVLKKFLNFVRGDIVTDAQRITEILQSEHRKFVNKIQQFLAPKG